MAISKKDRERLLVRVADCQRKLRADSHDSAARYALAHALRKLGLPAEALEHFQIVIRQHPDAALEASLGAAECLAGLKRHTEALAVLQQVLEHDGRWPRTYALQGECLAALRRLAEAQAAFETGLTLVLPNEECAFRLREGLQATQRLNTVSGNSSSETRTSRLSSITLLTPTFDPLKVSKKLRDLGAVVKFEGPSHNWQKAIGYFGAGLQCLTFSYDPADHREPNWSAHLNGIRGRFLGFPNTRRKPRALTLLGVLRFALHVTFEPKPASTDDPRVQAMLAVAAILDGVLITPDALLDAGGRVLFCAGGESAEDPQATWPRAVAAIPIAELANPAPNTPPGAAPRARGPSRGPEAPDASRVARRALALVAVTARAIMEQGASDPKAPADYADLAAWVQELGIDEELEPQERAVLQSPLGGLDPSAAIQASWRLEGLVVLAWSLGLFALPPHDQLVDVRPLWRSLGLCDGPASRSLLSGARLRSPDEVGAMRDRLFALHWRLRQFTLKPAAMEFAEFARTCWFGPLDISGMPLMEGDLALQGQRLDRVPRDVLETVHSSAQERHQAANWLCEGPGPYSAASVAT